MSVSNFHELKAHVGHKVQVVQYGEANVAIECTDCNEVLQDFDRNECPFGGETTNDCEGCSYTGDYHFVDGECKARGGDSMIEIEFTDKKHTSEFKHLYNPGDMVYAVLECPLKEQGMDNETELRVSEPLTVHCIGYNKFSDGELVTYAVTDLDGEVCEKIFQEDQLYPSYEDALAVLQGELNEIF